ncbi:WecB/TagA/CpsF family glycosyltransferase, partial [Microbacteriaceae bacterium K1510]|nr:WecB/TagA/CpsF family glycosyltransferase [Microbacteriaceae bacterium K1510]
MNLPIRERVTGVELLEGLMQAADQRAWKIYLLGAAPDVNQAAADQLAQRYPHAQLVGHRHGYFEKQDEQMIIREIAELKPDLLFVAMGAPRQDIWIASHWQELQVPLAIGIGGSLDVISGKVKRAPMLWQRMHLEWLYRLLAQP